MSKNHKLANRLNAYVGALSCLIFVAALVVLYSVGRTAVTEKVTQQGEKVTEAIQFKTEQVAQTIEQIAQNLAWFVASGHNEQQVTEWAQHAIATQPMIQHIALQVEPPTRNTQHTPMVFQIDRNGQTNVVWLNKTSYPQWYVPYPPNPQNKTVAYALPILDSLQQPIGTLQINISTESIAQAVVALKLYKGAEVTITSYYGAILFSPKSDDGVDNVKGKQCLVFHQKSEDKGWAITLQYPEEEVFAQQTQLNALVAMVLVVGLVLLYVFLGWVVRRMIAPLSAFDAAAQQIAVGNFDTPLPTLRHRDELQTLGASIEFMQHALKEYIEQLRQTTATKERIENELTVAATIQRSILNDQFPRWNDFDTFAEQTPARQVGGDLYDITRLGDRLWFVVGDASGKGVPASLYMSIAVSIFRTMIRQSDDLAQITATINSALARNNASSMFVTLLLGVIDTRQGTIELCNAGHNPPIFKTPTRTELIRQQSNIALGVVEDFAFQTQRYPFPPNAALVLYTDGVTESRNAQGEEFGTDPLIDRVASSRHYHPELLTTELLTAVARHSAGAEQNDDITTMVITRYAQAEDLEPELPSIAHIRPFIERLATQNSDRLLLATEEVAVNAIHYAQTLEAIELSAIVEEQRVVLYVEDRGFPFDPTAAPAPDTQAPIDQRNPGGLGIWLAKQMTDRMEYHRLEESNVVALEQSNARCSSTITRS